MSKYIKFDDTVKIMACEMYAEAQSQGYDVDGIEDFMPEAKAWITDAPSIDICFCKECRYCKKKRGTFKGEPITFYRCEENNRDVESDDFCSYGVRKGADDEAD